MIEAGAPFVHLRRPRNPEPCDCRDLERSIKEALALAHETPGTVQVEVRAQCHPSNFGRETSAAMDEAIALVGESLMDEIESYLRNREPRR